MSNHRNPLYWLAVEVLAILVGGTLVWNLFQYQFVELTLEQSVIIALIALALFWWGSSKIEDSSYTNRGLIRYRVVKPLWRATKQAFEEAAKQMPSLDVTVKFFQETQKRRQSEQIVEDFVTIAFDELAMEPRFRPSGDEKDRLADEIATETSQFKRDGYRRISNTLFSDQSTDEEKSRLILVLCREHVKADDTLATGETIHDIKSGIARALSASSCDFEQWNDAAQHLLTAYGNAYGAIHHGDTIETDPLTGTPEKPLDDYYSDFIEYFLPFRERSALSEELVATVIEVVDRGELDQSAVARDIDTLIEEEKGRVRAEYEGHDAYLLMSWGKVLTKSQDTREKLQQKYPNHIDFGYKSNESDIADLPDDIILTFHIIFTERSFESSEEFLNDVRSIVPDEVLDGGFVSAYELDVTSPAFLPPRDEVEDIVPKTEKKQLELIEFLETGTSSRAVTEAAIDNLLGRKISVRELLAAVPVNVFVDATPKQQHVVDVAYEELKDELEIDELYHWGRYEPEDIAPLLREYDDDGVASNEEWTEIAEQMITSARRCERAATS